MRQTCSPIVSSHCKSYRIDAADILQRSTEYLFEEAVLISNTHLGSKIGYHVTVLLAVGCSNSHPASSPNLPHFNILTRSLI